LWYCLDHISGLRAKEGTFAWASDQYALRNQRSLTAEAVSGADKRNDLRL